MEAYIDNRYVDVRVDFLVINNKAQKEAYFSSEKESIHSKIKQIRNDVRRQSKKIATAETKEFLLDGSYELVNPNDNIETGWRGNKVSDSSGNITSGEELTAKFQNKYSSYGFTIYFDDKANEYAKEIIIEAYRNGELISSKRFSNANIIFKSEFPVEDYDKIIFKFTKTNNPFRKIRVTEIYFGLVEEFDSNSIKDMRLIREVSLDNNVLPFCEAEVVINNSDKKYNMLNPEGVYKYLQENHALDVKLGIGDSKETIEYVNVGKYYFSEAKTSDNSITASIVARDKLSLLEKEKYIKTDELLLPGTFEKLIQRIIAFSKLDIKYMIKDDLKDILMQIVTTQEMTCKEALRLSCQAACCCCFFDKNDVLVFKKINESQIKDILDFDKITEYPVIEVGEAYNTVVLKNSEKELAKVSNKKPNETEKLLEISNDFIIYYRAKEVAEFILNNSKILKYSIISRGNPEIDIGDTIKVYDAFDVNRNAIITRQEFNFDGSLKANINAQGVMG